MKRKVRTVKSIILPNGKVSILRIESATESIPPIIGKGEKVR